MRNFRTPSTVSLIAVVSLGVFVVGCSPLSGTYVAEHRLIEGMTGSSEPGYTLEDFQAVRARDKGVPSLVLDSNGRFEWFTGDVDKEGAWRVKGDTLFLRSDKSDGRSIGSLLQLDREWEIAANGEIIRTDAFQLYHMVEVYVPQ